MAAQLTAALEPLRDLAQEIRYYRERAARVLLGAQNLIAFNPTAPSNVDLQNVIAVYQNVVQTADTALTAIAALLALAALGFPDLPRVPVSTAAWADLTEDMETNEQTLGIMTVAGAVAVTSEVGEEVAVPRPPAA